ncbi:hypothetical protein ABID23_000910 [Bartonella silvatica]|uniref:Uncharacterized protein n=1 Tax=Bartonella silvatica TaxID=357760 RepID=A0ABV2HGZ0_9HYPH
MTTEFHVFLSFKVLKILEQERLLFRDDFFAIGHSPIRTNYMSQ